MDPQNIMPQISQEASSDLLNKVIIQAIESRASDIHFEPGRNGLNIRLRIDGLLRPLNILITENPENIISRIKVMAQLNITERRVPQDGHYELKYNNKFFNFRISTLPTIFGEAIVLRILNREDSFTTIEKLGLLEDQLELCKQLISLKAGMVLTTGPTGSGKTSLLYSIIKTVSNNENNIVTLEDPIEYEMEGIRQTPINESLGLTFAKAMRAVLRQDPNYIMLGEIRDADTAQIAIQATLSGITVYSTFHTFDVPFLINRLKEMGITNSIIAQSIKGVIATRLVRKVCQSCKVPYTLNEFERKIWGDREIPSSLVIGKGCPLCLQTGYVGRTGLYEIIPFDQDIKSCVVDNKPALYIYELLKNKHIRTLREVGYMKAAIGETSVPEIIRVLGTFD